MPYEKSSLGPTSVIRRLHAESPDFCHPLTLAEVVDIALENHPSTQTSWWNARRAAAVVGVAKSAYYPKFDFVSKATHGKDFQFINGPNKEFTSFDADITLSMLLYDFGQTNASVVSAKRALLAASWHSDWVLQQVMVRAIEEAYATLHSQATLNAALASLEDAGKMLHSARELNRVGLRAVTDVYTSQATFAQLQMEAAQQQANYDIQRGKLATRMGLSADTIIELACLDAVPGPHPEQLSALIACANDRRADLMAKQYRVAESSANLEKSSRAYYPKVSMFGRGGAKHYAGDDAVSGRGEIGVRLEFPLFDGFERVYRQRQALADMKISCNELAQLQLDIALEVLTYRRNFQAAQEMLGFAEENLENATKAYDGVLTKYKAGRDGIAEVSNALRQLSNARVRYSDVRTRYHLSMANLAYATGTLPPYVMVSCEQQ